MTSFSDLITGDATANFVALMKSVSDRWNDRIKAVLYAKTGGRGAGNRRKPEMKKIIIERIVSGGQTGADRAALDFAIEHGLKHGGWCPKGRRDCKMTALLYAHGNHGIGSPANSLR